MENEEKEWKYVWKIQHYNTNAPWTIIFWFLKYFQSFKYYNLNVNCTSKNLMYQSLLKVNGIFRNECDIKNLIIYEKFKIIPNSKLNQLLYKHMWDSWENLVSGVRQLSVCLISYPFLTVHLLPGLDGLNSFALSWYIVLSQAHSNGATRSPMKPRKL